jgi:DNA-binding transcriptional LysR family regulator
MRQHEVADPATTGTADLRDVRAFCAVVDLGSITAAAGVLGESKGNVSRRVSRLERALGVALVRRGPRSVQPTDEGVVYRTRVRDALELFDQAASAVADARTEPRGKLRVTAPTDLAIGLFAPIVARFVEAHPAVRVEMLATDRTLDVEAQQIDVALRVGAALRDSSLIAHRLIEMDLGLFASPAYLERAGAPRRFEDLARHRVLALAAMGDPLRVPLARRGTRRPRASEALRPAISGDGAFVRETALAGAGIAILPTIIVRRDVEEGALVHVLPRECADERERVPVTLLHPRVLSGSPKVRAFRDFLVAALAPDARRRTARSARATR